MIRRITEMPRTTATGADPGTQDGSVAVRGPTTRGAAWIVASWTRVIRQKRHAWEWRVTSWIQQDGAQIQSVEPPSFTRSISDGLLEIFGVVPMESGSFAVERITKHHGKGNGLIPLAESAGEIRGAMAPSVGRIEVQRPMPSVWRMDVLGLDSATGEDECARAAMAAVRGVMMPGRKYVVDLGVGWPASIALNDHEADAICIAIWGAGCRLGAAEAT